MSVLYTHESFLDELTEGEWKASVNGQQNLFSLGTNSAVHRKMLFQFIAEKNIKIKPQNRGIKTMMDRLRNEGAFTLEVNNGWNSSKPSPTL